MRRAIYSGLHLQPAGECQPQSIGPMPIDMLRKKRQIRKYARGPFGKRPHLQGGKTAGIAAIADTGMHAQPIGKRFAHHAVKGTAALPRNILDACSNTRPTS